MTYVYMKPDNTLIRVDHPLPVGRMRAQGWRPMEGPEGFYAVIAVSENGHKVTGTVEGTFDDAVEIALTLYDTSTEIAHDFTVENRPLNFSTEKELSTLAGMN